MPQQGGAEAGVQEEKELEMDIDDEVSEEGRAPTTLKDPGRPTEAQADRHNSTHLPYRSSCPACVAGRARDRPHQKKEGQEERGFRKQCSSAPFWGCSRRIRLSEFALRIIASLGAQPRLHGRSGV